mgnify:CR=1 FL=1
MEKLQCLICLKWFSHLGSHIWHRHKILAKEYKMQFGLSIKTPLISDQIKLKKQIAFNQDRKKYLDNIKEKGKKFQFKKGQYKKTYYSRESLDQAVEQLDKINARKAVNCPFCNMLTHHLESHIYNAHGYLKVKRG